MESDTLSSKPHFCLKDSPYLMQLRSFMHVVCTGQEGEDGPQITERSLLGFIQIQTIKPQIHSGSWDSSGALDSFQNGFQLNLPHLYPPRHLILVAQTLSRVKPAANAEATYYKDKSLIGEAASAKQPVKACQQLSKKLQPGRAEAPATNTAEE